MTKKIFKKLDKRNTGHGYWKYYVNRSFYYSGNIVSLYQANQLFYSWREWCWSTWGPSKELDAWLEDYRHFPSDNTVSHNEQWCFQHNQFATRIYLRTDKELSMFLLRWSQ